MKWLIVLVACGLGACATKPPEPPVAPQYTGIVVPLTTPVPIRFAAFRGAALFSGKMTLSSWSRTESGTQSKSVTGTLTATDVGGKILLELSLPLEGYSEPFKLQQLITPQGESSGGKFTGRSYESLSPKARDLLDQKAKEIGAHWGSYRAAPYKEGDVVSSFGEALEIILKRGRVSKERDLTGRLRGATVHNGRKSYFVSFDDELPIPQSNPPGRMLLRGYGLIDAETGLWTVSELVFYLEANTEKDGRGVLRMDQSGSITF